MPYPLIPADLKATIDGHMRLFAGWQMMADEAGGDPQEGAQQGADEEADKGDGDKPLGPNGEKALQAEREARRKSDAEVQALKAQMSRLAEAFGVKPADAKSDDDGKVDALAKSVDAILHHSAVERVARDHQITDKDDLALLREQTTEAAMEKLAKRLQPPAKNDDDGTKSKRRPPAPDRSQGHGSGDGAKPSVSQVMAERRAARAAREATK